MEDIESGEAASDAPEGERSSISQTESDLHSTEGLDTAKVRKVVAEDERYPLRGRPYRYDRPYDAVGAEDWGTRR